MSPLHAPWNPWNLLWLLPAAGLLLIALAATLGRGRRSRVFPSNRRSTLIEYHVTIRVLGKSVGLYTHVQAFSPDRAAQQAVDAVVSADAGTPYEAFVTERATGREWRFDVGLLS